MHKGYIPTLREPIAGGAERLIDEHYVARAAWVFHNLGLAGRAGSNLMTKILDSKLKVDHSGG